MHLPSTQARITTPVIYLDRDGVINENRDDYVKSWQEFRFLPGALEALRLLTERGFTLFVVTNQAGVNRGLMQAETVEDIHRHMLLAAEAHGAQILEARYCPHRPDESCFCRKPRPGMLLGLAAEHGVSSRDTFMVGDALSDVAAGRSVGCRTVMVRTGRGAEQLAQRVASAQKPDHVAADLLEAARWLIAQYPKHLPPAARHREAHPIPLPLPTFYGPDSSRVF